jgi:tetratricopeptide (TPR) repeat protein
VWEEAEEELAVALALFEKIDHVQLQGVTWAYRALRTLLMGNVKATIEAARRALELADETAHTIHPVERDYVRVHWLLGAAHRANGDLENADRDLNEALTRCRSINLVEMEADILLDLARLRAATRSFDSAQDDREEALRLAQEALLITERCGYVLQGADVHLFLAQMALEDGDKETALEHAREACRLATCDGPPGYTYKVAYDEAGALLQWMESG